MIDVPLELYSSTQTEDLGSVWYTWETDKL